MNSTSKTGAIVALVVGLVIGVGGCMLTDKIHDYRASGDSTHMSMSGGDKKLALDQAMRQLWSDHMQYTYMTVRAFADNPKALQPTLDRLLQNQKDIGNAIVPFYGQEAGDKLSALLTTHIQEAVPVLTAAKAGNTVALNKALADWYANAKEIADFLSSANPNSWPASTTEAMMKEHIDTTVAYSTDVLQGNYAQADVDYDKAYAHMMMMADTLTDGIITQYPNKF